MTDGAGIQASTAEYEYYHITYRRGIKYPLMYGPSLLFCCIHTKRERREYGMWITSVTRVTKETKETKDTR